MWDSRRGGGDTTGVNSVRRSDTTRMETSLMERPGRETTTTHKSYHNCYTLLCTGGHSCNAHACAQVLPMLTEGLTATAAREPLESGENLRNGTTRNFRYLKPSFTFLLLEESQLLTVLWEHSTCDTHPSTDTAHVQLGINRCLQML